MPDLVKQYFKSISKYQVLPEEEIRGLIEKAQNGSRKARNKIMLHNLRLVITVSTKYVHSKIDKMDLISEGNFGLIKAIDSFNLKRHTKFSTWAHYWIRQCMGRYIDNHAQTVRVPVYLAAKIRQINCKITDNKRLTDMEHRFWMLGRLYFKSLDFTFGDSKNSDDLEDILIIPGTIPKFSRHDILVLMKCLNEREVRIINYRLDGLTLKMIADKFHLSRERIRQIINTAVKKMQSLT